MGVDREMNEVNSQKCFQVTLKKSVIGCSKSQKETVRCLGLRKIGSKRVFSDTPTIRGKIIKSKDFFIVKSFAVLKLQCVCIAILRRATLLTIKNPLKDV